jgi:hypothetical protein
MRTPKQYTPAEIEELARLSTEAESESAGVAAIKELLDVAYGEEPSGEDGEPNDSAF